MLDMEIWKDVIGYEGCYQISSDGRVKSSYFGKSKILRTRIIRNGYVLVDLRLNKVKKSHYIHRLLATAFIPNNKNKKQVNHKDGVKCNNIAENLEWVTPLENIIHGYDTGLNKNTGEGHPNSKLKEDDIKSIKRFLTEGIDYKTIAEDFNVHSTLIYQINKGVIWKHVNI